MIGHLYIKKPDTESDEIFYNLVSK